LEVFFGGDSRVHNDEGSGGSLEALEHFLQGAAFVDVAFEYFRVPDKAAGIQGDVFGADGAWVDQMLGVDIEFLEFLGLPDF
jgi:hypothetical protein